MTHQPSTHWDSELRFKLQFPALPCKTDMNEKSHPVIRDGSVFINGYPSGDIPRRRPECRWR